MRNPPTFTTVLPWKGGASGGSRLSCVVFLIAPGRARREHKRGEARRSMWLEHELDTSSDEVHPPRDPRIDVLLRCWTEQRGDLLRYCQRSLGQADGEEAFSQATLVMLRAVVSTEALRRPQAWLQRIVHCVCVDAHRERARRGRRLVLAPSGEDLVETAAPTEPAPPDPERTYLEREALAQVKGAIRALPLWLRVPLLLRVEDDLSYADMATVLLDSEENLRKRVQIARKAVRRSVLGDESDPL